MDGAAGPAARGDTGTIARHLRALPPGERPAYRAMADEASRLAGRRPDDRDREMRTITTIAELRGELDAARAAADERAGRRANQLRR